MIRKSALILISVVTVLFVVGFFLVDDLLLEDTAETLLEAAFETDVEIKGLDLAPLDMSVSMGGMTIQDKEEPWKNMAQTGPADFEIMGMQLFAKKVVIQKLNLEDLTLGATRPGESKADYPAEEKKKKSAGSEDGSEEEDEESSWSLGSMTESVDFDALLKEMDLEGLVDPKKLKSMIELEKVKKESAERQKYWDGIFADDRLKNEEARLKKESARLKAGTYKSPTQIQQGVKDLQQFSKDTKAYIKEVQDLKSRFQKDMKATQDGVKRVQRLAKEDARAVQDLANIGNMDFSKMGKAMFGPAMAEKIEMVLGYIKTSREVIASGKPEDIKKRNTGRTFSFPVTSRVYPEFLILQSNFSGKMLDDAGKATHKLVGQAKDITSNADVLGKPTTMTSVVTQISNGAIYNVDAVFDHRGGTFKDTFNIIGNDVKMDDIQLRKPSEGSAMPHMITSPNSDVKILVTMEGEILTADFIVVSKDVKFVFAGKASSSSNQQLRDSISEIKEFEVKATISGKLTALKFKVDSDLDNKLAAQFKKAMGAKTKAAQDKIQGNINNNLNKNGMGGLTGSKSNDKNQQELASMESSGNTLQAGADAKKKEIQNQAQNKLKKQLENKLKGLFR